MYTKRRKRRTENDRDSVPKNGRKPMFMIEKIRADRSKKK